MNTHSDREPFEADVRGRKARLASFVAAFTLLAVFFAHASASASVTIPVDPGDGSIESKRKQVTELALTEAGRNVTERNGDNVPRYRNGKGRIAPYSIGDAWCVAFATWTWNKAGFGAYMGTRLLREAYGGDLLAVQVRGLSTWARRNGFWTLRATPGDLVAYGDRHIGVVTAVDRRGRAVRSIEGNYSNSVGRVNVPMASVSGYISPVKVPTHKQVTRSSELADVD